MTARLLRICLLFAGPASAWCHSPLSISVVMSSLSNRMKSHRSRLGLVIVLWMICLPVGGLGAGRSVASGTLEIKADPGTTILLDGLPIGTSDDDGRADNLQHPSGSPYRRRSRGRWGFDLSGSRGRSRRPGPRDLPYQESGAWAVYQCEPAGSVQPQILATDLGFRCRDPGSDRRWSSVAGPPPHGAPG